MIYSLSRNKNLFSFSGFCSVFNCFGDFFFERIGQFFLKVIAVEFHLFDQIGIPFDNFLGTDLIFCYKVSALAALCLQLSLDLVLPCGLDILHTVCHGANGRKVDIPIWNVFAGEFPLDCAEFMVKIEQFFGFFFNFVSKIVDLLDNSLVDFASFDWT